MIVYIFVVLLVLILNLLNIRVCIIYNVFHIPCPGCGCTRAVIELLKGNVIQSINYNPLPIIIGIVCVILLIWKCKDIIEQKNTLKKFIEINKNIILLICIVITIIIWIININNPLLY